MKNLVIIVNLLCLVGFSVSAQSETATAVNGSAVVMQHTNEDARVSMRFEVTGDMVEIKRCKAPVEGPSALRDACQFVGSASTAEMIELLEAGWFESIMADAEQTAYGVGGGIMAAVVVGFALEKMTNGMVSKSWSAPHIQLLHQKFLSMFVIMSGGLAGSVASFWGYEQTEMGQETREIDNRNDLAKKLRSGETVFEAKKSSEISNLFTYVAGQLDSVK